MAGTGYQLLFTYIYLHWRALLTYNRACNQCDQKKIAKCV